MVSDPDPNLKLKKIFFKKIIVHTYKPWKGHPARLQREHLVLQKLTVAIVFPFQGPAVRPSWKPDPDLCTDTIRIQSGLRSEYATLFEREKINVANPGCLS
jgi:hypothetical protein